MPTPTEAATPKKGRNKPSISRTPRSIWKGDELGKNKTQKSIKNYFFTTPVRREATSEGQVQANVRCPNETRKTLFKPSMPACKPLVTSEPITISDDEGRDQSSMENYHMKSKTTVRTKRKSNVSLSRKLHKTKSVNSYTACSATKVTESPKPESSTSGSLRSEVDSLGDRSPRKRFRKQNLSVTHKPTPVISVISYAKSSTGPEGSGTVPKVTVESPFCEQQNEVSLKTCVTSPPQSRTESSGLNFCQDEIIEISSQEYSAELGNSEPVPNTHQIEDRSISGDNVNACSALLVSRKDTQDPGSSAVNIPRIRAKTEAEMKLAAETAGLGEMDWSPMEEELKLASPMKSPTNAPTTPQKCTPVKRFPSTPTKPTITGSQVASSVFSAGQKYTTPLDEPPRTPSKATTSQFGLSTPSKRSPYKSPKKGSPKKSPMKLDREAMSGNVVLEHSIVECKRYARMALKLNSTIKKVADDYMSLFLPEKVLLHKLLVRKWAWLRDIDMKYEKIVQNKINSLDALRDKGFLEDMSPSEPLRVILEQLKRPELETLCKQYKVDSSGTKKDEVINRLCKFVSLQGGLGFTSKSLKTVLTNAAFKSLGKCVRIREDTRKILQTIFEASMSPLHLDGQFYSFQQRLSGMEQLMNGIKFEGKKLVPFPLSDFQLFLSPAQFDEFITSVILKFEILSAKDERNNVRGLELARDARASLLIYLNSPVVKEFLNKTPRYIWRYTAGSNYTSAIDVGIDFLKRAKEYDDAILTIDVLLAQGYFRKHCRGRWYAEKVMIMDKQLKKPAAEIYPVLMAGLIEDLTPIGHLELSKKAEGVINKKKGGLTPEQKENIKKLMRIPKLRHTVKEIRSTEAPNVSVGTRQTFVEFSATGERTYLNVEQVARNSYLGEFPEGMHDEGSFMKSIILATFWPVIYMPKENMFVSRYQNAPLDWGTQAFYRNRQEDIQVHISRLREGGIDSVMKQITDVVTVYTNHHSLISWFNISFDMLPTIKNILTCLTLDKFLKLADYLLESFRERRSGWPDLTLWNTVAAKFKLVEVKSPNDELSLKQIVWLEKFAEIGIDVEECRVNASNKGKKRKAIAASVQSDASQEIM